MYSPKYWTISIPTQLEIQQLDRTRISIELNCKKSLVCSESVISNQYLRRKTSIKVHAVLWRNRRFFFFFLILLFYIITLTSWKHVETYRMIQNEHHLHCHTLHETFSDFIFFNFTIDYTSFMNYDTLNEKGILNTCKTIIKLENKNK